MLLQISTTHRPATDLGYLLHKHPARAQTFGLSFGQAHVYYPEATEDRCTAALLVEVDPVALVRGRGQTLDQYVNDRPYAASSFLSTAISKVYRSAMGGRCTDRPELVETAIPLEASLPSLPARGGVDVVRRLFEPLGYEVEIEEHPLDETFPAWGQSPYVSLTLRGTVRLADLLTHLYVLVPALDARKHYYIGPDEVDKLLARGEGWLAAHTERDLITRRYLRFRSLSRPALDRLAADDPVPDDAEAQEAEDAIEKPVRLNDQRMTAVHTALKESGAQTVIDLGCGEGRLLRELIRDGQFRRIVGVDVSVRALERARDRLHLGEDAAPALRERVSLRQGSLVYRDPELAGFDAAALVEVIEHLDLPRLAALEQAVFADARPGTVVVTTPNAEYNSVWETLPAGRFRHPDHRFEWTRAELAKWAGGLAERHGYRVEYRPVGPEDSERGAPTQMALFTREAAA
ncbi:MAG: 3' terminal RNA ribose 2'-O-methyltransferase Hen1 [Bacteroidota bacterium]